MAQDYEIIIVGGGLAGAAFTKAMAENGSHVLVVERAYPWLRSGFARDQGQGLC